MDERFKHVATDPKFRRVPRNKKNVKIDKRFQSMFHSKKFKGSSKVDMRGRPIKQSVDKDLKKYYEINSEDESESDEEKKGQEEDEEKELKVKYNTDKVIPKTIAKRLKDMDIDYARGEGDLYSESSSDDEETDEEVEEIEHNWGELDADAEETNEISHRLAACHMDWDRIRAVDLMVLMTSFLPAGGSIVSVDIYPSEFGKQRMAEEDIKGPKELVTNNNEDIDEDDEENEEGSKYHMEKLRQYQLNRLKYYYAVITFDNDNSANKVYTECDGMEYESSATKMDLRFIPNDMTFDDVPKETCNKLPDSSRYEPRFFTTTALQQSKVDLTWDETNQDRKEITEKLANGKIDDISEADLQNYLASSSGDESDGDQHEEHTNESAVASDSDSNDNPIDKYKALLADIEEKEKEKKNRDIGMEISWGVEVQEKTDALIKKKREECQNKTPFQEFLDKKNQKRKDKKKFKKQQNEDDVDSEESDIPSDIDMNDPYFAEEFDKPEFKKKKNKKIAKASYEEVDDQKQAELELLLLNEAEDEKKHFSLKQIQDQENDKKSKKKMKKKKNVDAEATDEFKVNVNDDRFSALFTSHHYNIDPSDSHYKKTKGMELLINEKLKRRVGDEHQVNVKRSKPNGKTQDAELSVLVKSVKRKAEAFGKHRSK